MYLRGNSIGTDDGRRTTDDGRRMTDDSRHTLNLSFYRKTFKKTFTLPQNLLAFCRPGQKHFLCTSRSKICISLCLNVWMYFVYTEPVIVLLFVYLDEFFPTFFSIESLIAFLNWLSYHLTSNELCFTTLTIHHVNVLFVWPYFI